MDWFPDRLHTCEAGHEHISLFSFHADSSLNWHYPYDNIRSGTPFSPSKYFNTRTCSAAPGHPAPDSALHRVNAPWGRSPCGTPPPVLCFLLPGRSRRRGVRRVALDQSRRLLLAANTPSIRSPGHVDNFLSTWAFVIGKRSAINPTVHRERLAHAGNLCVNIRASLWIGKRCYRDIPQTWPRAGHWCFAATRLRERTHQIA